MTHLRTSCACGLLTAALFACATSPAETPPPTPQVTPPATPTPKAPEGSRLTALEGPITVGFAPQRDGFWAWLHDGEGLEEPDRCVWTLTTAKGEEVATLDFLQDPDARDDVSGPCAITISSFPEAEAAWPIQGPLTLALAVQQGERGAEGAARYTFGDDLGEWGQLFDVLERPATEGSLGMDAGPVHALSASGHLLTLRHPAGGEPLYGEIFLGAPAEGGWALCELTEDGATRRACCAPAALRPDATTQRRVHADVCTTDGDTATCCAATGPWRISLSAPAPQAATLRDLILRLSDALNPQHP